MCFFDIIILINLISNRSYIDLNQYPVFPLLFFLENNILKERDLKEHIGFQDSTDEAKKRTAIYKETYFLNKMAKEGAESESNDNEFLNDNIYYFNTHYSNIVYTTNFLIRLFPFSFLAIELQGDGFDDPNRLFFSIEKSFFNISYQKSDLRELIPEFFYLPEMFINLNYINFKDKRNGERVNDVEMPKNLLNIYNQNTLKERDDGEFSVIYKINQEEKNSEFSKIFFFVDYMKKKLESLKGSLCSWLNIIFGTDQRFKYNGKKKEQLFRTESYINNINEEITKRYINDDLAMQSIEFGLIPLQTIFDSKILNKLENKEYNYEKIDEKTKNEINKIKGKKSKRVEYINEKKKTNNIIEVNKYKGLKILDKEKVDKILDISFNINNKDNLGKFEIYIDNKLIGEMYDHTDKIIDIYFNERLNMFATTSLDGLVCIYIFPNKLFSIIKNKNNSYFDRIYLSSNPFPTIITFDNKNRKLSSYSLSGLLIKEKKIKGKGITLKPIFNIYGGAEIDRIKVFNESYEFYTIYNLPFFDEVKFE